VVALLFKYFFLEISKIPSGSMQPTLLGNPETQTFDRTVVDKLSYQFRDPERFEIVVFKHPLEHSRVMVKRLVGMPGEDLKIEHGDLWMRPDGAAEWEHLRRPPAVQRAMWRSLEMRGERRNAWGVVRDGEAWRTLPGSIVARGPGAARYAEEEGPITDEYRDGYPPAIAGRVAVRDPDWGRIPVGDVRLEGRVRAEEGTETVVVELTEGPRLYRFLMPGPAAAPDARLAIRASDPGDGSGQVEALGGPGFRLPIGRQVDFAVENLDDRLTFEVDGDPVLSVDVQPSAQQEARLTLVVEGSGAELEDLQVFRDIYYLPRPRQDAWTVSIPPGNFVMLGDNTQDSADSRLWDAVTYTWHGPDGETTGLHGNYRPGENPVSRHLAEGPAVRFRDHWGEVTWLTGESARDRTLPGNEPLVPRELILGRGLAVFWPLRPMQGLWRLGWLH
jgi:signal peptidase I